MIERFGLIHFLKIFPAFTGVVLSAVTLIEPAFAQLSDQRSGKGFSPYQEWTQEVAYTIKARLVPEESKLYANLTVNYKNNSPDALGVIYFHLYPNGYRKNSIRYREAKKYKESLLDEGYPSFFEDGYVFIKDVFLSGNGSMESSEPLNFQVNETIMKVFLPEVLKPGSSTSLKVEFILKIPRTYFRFGRFKDEFRLAQWYPKVCVYDEDGWHLEQYHMVGEFFGEFADWNVTIVVPENYCVAASGNLISSKKNSSFRVLNFALRKAHDFAWVASPNLKKLSRVISLKTAGDASREVRIEVYYSYSSRDRASEVLDYAGKALKFYSGRFGVYPYDVLKVVEVRFLMGGMEYPTLVMISADAFNSLSPFERTFCEATVAHEISHQWWYAVVAPDEFNHPWIDEGLATFSERLYIESFYGKFNNMFRYPGWLRWLPNHSFRSFEEFVYGGPNSRGYLHKPDSPSDTFVDDELYYPYVYLRPSFLFDELRTLYGEEKFDSYLKSLFRDYSFKHVYPEDLVELAETTLGKDSKKLFEKYVFSQAPLAKDEYCGLAETNITGFRVALLDLPKGREFLLTALPVVFPVFETSGVSLAGGAFFTLGQFLPFMVFVPFYSFPLSGSGTATADFSSGGSAGGFSYIFYTFIPYPLFKKPVRSTDFEFYSYGGLNDSGLYGDFRFTFNLSFSRYFSRTPVYFVVPTLQLKLDPGKVPSQTLRLYGRVGFKTLGLQSRSGVYFAVRGGVDDRLSSWHILGDLLFRVRLLWRTYISLNWVSGFYREDISPYLRYPFSHITYCDDRADSVSCGSMGDGFLNGLTADVEFPITFEDFYLGFGAFRFIRLSSSLGASVFSLRIPSFESWESFSRSYKDYFVEPYISLKTTFSLEPVTFDVGVALSPWVFSNLAGDSPPQHTSFKFFVGSLF